MDDLMSKLQSVLNDSESMKQLQELAGMLANETPNNNSQGAGAGSNDFSQLISSLGNTSENRQSTSQGIDIAKLIQLKGIMEQANKPDKNVDLLLALRPLLKEENQAKIDRLVKIFKLFAVYPALKQSGLLGGDLFGIL